MDNLFAVIVPNNDPCTTNTIINKQLSSVRANNSASTTVHIINENMTVYLLKYSSKPPTLVDNTQAAVLNKDHSTIGNTRIDNKNDLLTSCNLESQGNKKAQLSDDLVLLSAYQKLGNACFAKLKGNFQTIFWDEYSQHFCAAIDAFSSRSLFYVKVGNALYIASNAKTLANVTNIKLTMNKVALSQWLAGRPTLNSSMYNEIVRLPAGHCLEYGSDQRINITKFWDIDPNFSIHYNNIEQYKAHFFDLLQTSVANRIAPHQLSTNTSVFCQMSGGMDSTSITAIAKKLLDEQNRTLHTISHQYTNTQSCDESANKYSRHDCQA